MRRDWIIPLQAVEDYKPGPQGFAAVKARKEAERARLLAEVNEAIRGGHVADEVDIHA